MYSALSANRFARFLLLGFGALLTLVIAFSNPPNSLHDLWSIISKATGWFLLGLSAFFGPTFYWSPWRILWRCFPLLNRVLFPDLNGVWLGTTNSNWPVVKALWDNAHSSGQLDSGTTDSIALQKNLIAVQIRASLFVLSLRAKLESTDGESKSLSASVQRDDESKEFDLSYTYSQQTPQASILDESSHTGAAIVRIGPESLAGYYWTRRSWRKGLNTAGLLTLKRAYDRHISSTADLITFAKAQ